MVRRDGRYLLVRRLYPPAADLYAFPGGRAEPGETPAEAAIRECAEETGIVGCNPRLYAEYDLVTRNDAGEITHHYFLSVFALDETGRVEAVAADDAGSCGWYLPEEILTMPVTDGVIECVQRMEADIILEAEA